MVKDILKVILSCIAAYPICFLVAYFEFSRESYMWLVILMIDIIVCCALTVCMVVKHKRKNRKKEIANKDCILENDIAEK